jgi:N-acetylneuraminic acid mutarotase
VVAATVLLLSVACSGGGHGAEGGTAATQHAASPKATTSSAPSAVSLSATTETWRLPDGVSRAVVLPDQSGFTVLGGLETGDTTTSRIVQVNPASGGSQVAGQLAVAVHDSAGAVISSRLFVFGGGSDSTVAAVQAWTAGTAAQVSSLPQARSDQSAATVGGTTYIVGGLDGSVMAPTVLATADGMSFRSVAQLAVPVRYAAVAGIGTTLWAVGGVTSTSEGGTAATDAVQKIDLATGQVTITSHLPQPMGHATALVLDSQIFVLGGRSGTVPSATIYRLDTTSGTLVSAGSLPQAVSDAGAVVVGGIGYLVGGETTGPTTPLNTVVQLRPSP